MSLPIHAAVAAAVVAAAHTAPGARVAVDVLAVECPTCYRPAGRRCTLSGGDGGHPRRREAARAAR